MTKLPPGFVCLRVARRRVPPSPLVAEWERRRHANEAVYWAEHLDEFVKRLPRMRHDRGEARAARLVRDVVAAIGQARGADEAVLARDRIRDVWRWAGRVRP